MDGLTVEQFSALAQLLRPSAKLDAARLVLVEGLRQTDAAALLGMGRQGVNQSVKRLTDTLALAARCSGPELTPDAFDALTELADMREGPRRQAVRIVLLDGLRQADAAIATGVKPGSISSALAMLRACHALARVVAPEAKEPGIG